VHGRKAGLVQYRNCTYWDKVGQGFSENLLGDEKNQGKKKERIYEKGGTSKGMLESRMTR